MGNIEEVIVVGGGIGGLAAAYGIGKLGKKVTVIEQAPAFGEVGAGLQLGPNGLRALDALGVLDEVYQHAVFPRRHVFMDALSGKELSSVQFGEAFEKTFGYPYIVIHRSDLHSVLLKACEKLNNIRFLTNHRLESVEEFDDYVELRCENGATLKGKLVIGADGIRSVVRQKLINRNSKPVPARYVAYRFTVPMSEMTINIDWDEKLTWIGPGIHLVQYPVRHKSVINQVAVFESQNYNEENDDWGTIDELYDMFKDCCPTVKESIKFAERGFVSKLHDINPLEKWSTKRVTLLGDSAHAMLQYLAQGACQALEDTVCLVEKLKEHEADLAKALDEYQKERIPRASQVQRGARMWGKIKHAKEDHARLLRDTIMLNRTPDDYTYLEWLYKDRKLASV
ncbi:FAD-dependent monooxygenase [Ureibacillus sp. FSL K6-8385]|uniref:FAD-dependent oxidoreductase n=1 Tax=Ureibacillus terrenus TaxID=118246 RepID=A0A540V3J0_9BACL|nr:FAD-dependent monooxygenase [Ureibacillus terrenus]MED3661862.1 FAD-dependent monooxygenase [Ureibacillus terrenus]MED3763163.1 FAD-dependent monooxygenase [Ureibacillus terrenus]TQE91332.1 FAD-dependent oxidoreductase [Ureibacillus terrenus]